MPSKVLVVNLCDLCFAQNEEVESVKAIPSPFDTKTALLVCKGHDQNVEESVEAVRALFAYATEVVPETPSKRAAAQLKSAKRVPCKATNEDGTRCTHRASTTSALSQHGRMKHGLNVQQMRDLGMEV